MRNLVAKWRAVGLSQSKSFPVRSFRGPQQLFDVVVITWVITGAGVGHPANRYN